MALIEKRVGRLRLNEFVLSGNVDDYVTHDDLCGLLSDITLSGYLDKKSGGTISGDLNIDSHDVKILSGNFIQTNTETITNYSSKNGFVQAEAISKYGTPSVGSKGWCILSVIPAINSVKLSGDVSQLTKFLNNEVKLSTYDPLASDSVALKNVWRGTTESKNAKFSVAIGSWGETLTYTLSSVDESTGIVTFNEQMHASLKRYSSNTEAELIDLFENDDNAFYLAGFPEVGNVVIHNFYAQHVEGGASRAVGKYTHAEGRDNIADVRYSHVEGSHNIAGNMASHAEGFRTQVLGRFAHAEGTYTTAFGVESHAEGLSTTALSDASHTEGSETYAAKYAHAEGEQTSALGIASHAEGRLTLASASGAHAEGQSSVASGVYSHAEGSYTSALSECAHSEGFHTLVSDSAKYSSATGYYSKANGLISYALGLSAIANDHHTFCWNGDSHVTTYASHGQGTLNVNPLSGLSGFYIGQNNFIECVLSAISLMTDDQKNQLKDALGLQ